jgi:hypothetical protein
VRAEPVREQPASGGPPAESKLHEG